VPNEDMMILVVFINIEDKAHAHKKHQLPQIMFSSVFVRNLFFKCCDFIFYNLHRAALSSFVIFDKIEG
jgi:hypothetical protein